MATAIAYPTETISSNDDEEKLSIFECSGFPNFNRRYESHPRIGRQMHTQRIKIAVGTLVIEGEIVINRIAGAKGTRVQ